MKQKLVIEYDPITQTLGVTENDFSTFEALGLLEATKVMIGNNWLNGGKNDEQT